MVKICPEIINFLFFAQKSKILPKIKNIPKNTNFAQSPESVLKHSYLQAMPIFLTDNTEITRSNPSTSSLNGWLVEHCIHKPEIARSNPIDGKSFRKPLMPILPTLCFKEKLEDMVKVNNVGKMNKLKGHSSSGGEWVMYKNMFDLLWGRGILDHGLEPHQYLHANASMWMIQLGCHVGCQEVSRCCTRGASEESFMCRQQSTQARESTLAFKPWADIQNVQYVQNRCISGPTKRTDVLNFF